MDSQLIPCDKLRAWAASIEPVQGAVVLNFLNEADAKMRAEVEAAKKCLADYGYKVLETQHHEYREL
jgi:hypothetical protein